MFGDTITVGGTVYTKINQDNFSSTYRFADATLESRINIRHSSRKDSTRGNIRVDRHNIEHSIVIYGTGGAADIPRKCYFVIECDYKDTPASVVTFCAQMPTYILASTNAALTKLVNQES